MATLNFGASDRKVFTPVSSAIGALSNGPGTMVVLIKKTTLGATDYVGLTDSGLATWYHALGQENHDWLWDDDNASVNASSGAAPNDITNWYLFANDWPSGTAQIERFHYRNQTSLGSWTHLNSAGVNTGQRAGPGTGGWLRLGYFGDWNTGAKDYAVAAIWAGTRFADGDYGSWTKTSDLYGHALGPPTFLCELNATTLIDLIGGSTYSSANSSGTTLTGAVPDNWTLDGVGSGGTGLIIPRRYINPNRQRLRAGPRALVERRLPSASPLAVSSTMTASARPVVAMTAAKGVSGTLVAQARPSVALAGGRSVTSTLTASAHPSVSMTAVKGGIGTLVTSARPVVTVSAAKGASGALAAQGRPSVAVAAQKGASGTLSTSARPVAIVAGTKGASGAITASAHPAVSITASKGVSGTLRTSARPIVSITGSSQPAFVGTMSVHARPVVAITAAKQAISTLTASARPATSITARKGIASSTVASARPVVVFSASLGARSVMAVTARAVVTIAGYKASTGVMAVRAHPRVVITGAISHVHHGRRDTLAGRVAQAGAGSVAPAPAGRERGVTGGILAP